MPFGLVTAPATLSHLVRRFLSDMDIVDNCIDDILVYTMTFQQHLKVLRELIQRLRVDGLTDKPSKCSIAFSNLSCLVHVVGS